MRVGLGLRVIALTAVGAIVMLATTTASASPLGNGFAGRARSAGLTAAQVGALQREVNVFVGRYGGRQVAINKVAFAGGSVLFPVAGHNARTVANVSAGRTVERINVSSCPLGDFCIWPSRNYSGTRDAFSACGINYADPYPQSQNGSWKNDQTPQNGHGPRVKMLAADGSVVYTTPPPYSSSSDFDFSGIAFFRIC